MEELKTSKEMKIDTLKARQANAIQGEELVWKKINENASQGMFYVWIYNCERKHPIVVSMEFIKELRKKGYTVIPREKNEWDDLHRFYQGLLFISWKR